MDDGFDLNFYKQVLRFNESAASEFPLPEWASWQGDLGVLPMDIDAGWWDGSAPGGSAGDMLDLGALEEGARSIVDYVLEDPTVVRREYGVSVQMLPNETLDVTVQGPVAVGGQQQQTPPTPATNPAPPGVVAADSATRVVARPAPARSSTNTIRSHKRPTKARKRVDSIAAMPTSKGRKVLQASNTTQKKRVSSRDCVNTALVCAKQEVGKGLGDEALKAGLKKILEEGCLGIGKSEDGLKSLLAALRATAVHGRPSSAQRPDTLARRAVGMNAVDHANAITFFAPGEDSNVTGYLRDVQADDVARVTKGATAPPVSSISESTTNDEDKSHARPVDPAVVEEAVLVPNKTSVYMKKTKHHLVEGALIGIYELLNAGNLAGRWRADVETVIDACIDLRPNGQIPEDLSKWVPPIQARGESEDDKDMPEDEEMLEDGDIPVDG